MNRREALLMSIAASAAALLPSGVALAAPTMVAFDFYRESRIFLKGQVAGHATDMMLDSGAGMTVIDKSFAESIGIKAESTMPVQGAGGTVQGGVAKIAEIKIGDFVLKDSRVLLLDLSSFTAKLGRPMPVVLGRNVFDAAVVDIDFPRQRIALHEPRGFAAPTGAIALPLTRTTTGVREVMVSLEGRAPVASTFDLGNGGAVLVSKTYADQQTLLQGRRSAPTLAGGVGGLTTHDVAMVGSLGLGGLTLHDIPAVFNRDERELPSHGLNIGIAVWKRFRLLIDYSRSTLWLIPDAQSAIAPFRKERAGLGVQLAGDRFEVIFVAPGGPAEAAGFKVGDRIAAIEGQAAGPNFYIGPATFWASAPAGTTARVTMADGSVRTITLADYY